VLRIVVLDDWRDGARVRQWRRLERIGDKFPANCPLLPEQSLAGILNLDQFQKCRCSGPALRMLAGVLADRYRNRSTVAPIAHPCGLNVAVDIVRRLRGRGDLVLREGQRNTRKAQEQPDHSSLAYRLRKRRADGLRRSRRRRLHR